MKNSGHRRRKNLYMSILHFRKGIYVVRFAKMPVHSGKFAKRDEIGNIATYLHTKQLTFIRLQLASRPIVQRAVFAYGKKNK